MIGHRTVSLGLWFGAFVLAGFAGCSAKTSVSQFETGGNTSWLSRCVEDAECGASGLCFEGVCTESCTKDANCADHSAAAACYAAGAPGRQCAAGDSVCMPTCNTNAECGGWDSTLGCVDGYCVPAACGVEVISNAVDASDAPLATMDAESPFTSAASSNDLQPSEQGSTPAPLASVSEASTSSAPEADGGAALNVEQQSSSLTREPGMGESDNSAAQDTRDFSWALYAIEEDPTENTLFSPYSISAAAAMLAAGAAGETKTEIQSALHFSTDGDAFHAAQNALNLVLEQRNHEATETVYGQDLQIVNDVWLMPGLPVEATFLDTLAMYYGSGVYFAPFDTAPLAARQRINEKVNEDTHELIPELIPEDGIDSSTRFVLTNALYINAHWSQDFVESQTQQAPFFGVDSTVDVPLMHNVNASVSYAETEEYQAVMVPFARGEFEFVAILPAAENFASFVSTLDSAQIDDITSGMTPASVELFLPRFEVKHTVPLAERLQALGMHRAFDLATADLSALSSYPLFISGAFHDAHLLIHEEGVEAGAGTAIVGGAGSAPPTPPEILVRLDHPFVFMIRDVESNVPLFVGHYAQPD